MIRILVPTGATLAGWLALACFASDGSASASATPMSAAPSIVADDPVAMPQRVVKPGDRSLHQQQPWSVKRIL